ncbi:hypothetical protein OA165_04515 [Prochlorococcus sp. AH-736-A21]|nr:hypothetical protein [Prochlorococcus sp. AH-736-A21]
MEINEVIYNNLINEISLNQDNKSSYWKFHTKECEVKNKKTIKGITAGYGVKSLRIPLISNKLHKYIQKKIFRDIHNCWNSRYYSHAKQVCALQNRSLDNDMLRHIFTFNCLFEQRLEKNRINRICSIGDGQTNFISLALLSKNFKKVISVNLPEIHLSDLNLISKLQMHPELRITICDSEKDLEKKLQDQHKRLILITARNQSIMQNKGIQLFANIASFMEMREDTISDYFKTIVSNKAYFYCCNREIKELPGGEILEFEKYPWGNPNIIFNEDCPWHQEYYYLFKGLIPLKGKYDGNFIHRLVKY